MNRSSYDSVLLRAAMLLTVLLLVAAAFSTIVFADTPFTITSGGIGQYNIVLCDNATIVEQTAANELQTYIYKVTGVTLAIVSESEAQDKSFMVGPTAFALANGVNPAGEEQWAIKNIGNRIIVTGGRTRGTLYAVYHLLEDEIGIRWWNLKEEYIPNLPTLTISNPIDKSGTPAFGYRCIFDATTDDSGQNVASTNKYNLFFVRNRLNGSLEGAIPAEYGGSVSFGLPSHVHTLGIMLPPEKYYAEHPEYYAYVNGERKKNGQLCLTNHNVQTLITQKTLDNIAASYAEADSKGLPRPTMFSITPIDDQGLCECPACQAERAGYGESGYILNFVNYVAQEVQATYPEVKIDALAYWFYIDPPKGGLTPGNNVQIRYANIGMDIIHPLSHANNDSVRSKLESWRNITSNDLIYWDYAVNYLINPPMPTMYNKKADYKYLLNVGVNGVLEEQEGVNVNDMQDMKVWMEAKLMENPDLDINALITDFTDKYYGAAGVYIRNYLNATKTLTDSTNNVVNFGTGNERYDYFTLDYLNAQELCLNNATAAVSGDPVLLQRVNMVRASLDRLVLIRGNYLYDEAQAGGIAMNFSKQASSTRIVNTLKNQKASRCMFDPGELVEQCYNCKSTDDQLLQLSIPNDLRSIPYNSLIDITSDNFMLYNAYGGLTNVTDNDSIIGHAARINLSDIADSAFRDLHKPLVDIGLYNPADGTRSLKYLDVSDIVPNQYKLYKIDSAQIKQNDYLYIFRSWSVQVRNLDTYLQGKPEQPYDIYLSMKFAGPSYGGNAADADCVYIERVILVEKGALPSELDSVPLSGMTDYSPESFFIYTGYGPIRRIEKLESSVGRTVIVELSNLVNETVYNMHLPPVPIGLYNSTDGTRVLGQITLSDITLDQYKIYKVENMQIKPNDYLYLFNSWGIHVPVDTARTDDPDQLYDLYVSMKFQGPAFGGDITKKDIVYIDRVIVVRHALLKNETVNSTSDDVTHTITPESNRNYFDSQ